MFSAAFIKHYPTPWRIQDREVVDRHGCNVQDFSGDTPEDYEFWVNVVAAVNSAETPSCWVANGDDEDDLLRVGEKVVEMAEKVKIADATDLGVRATWHLEMGDERYRVVMTVAGTPGIR